MSLKDTIAALKEENKKDADSVPGKTSGLILKGQQSDSGSSGERDTEDKNTGNKTGIILGNILKETPPRETENVNAKPAEAETDKEPNVVIETTQTETTADAKTYSHPTQLNGIPAEVVNDFQTSLDVLIEDIEDFDLVRESIVNISNSLREHPAFKDLVLPEHMGAMATHLRESYGTTIQKKQGRRAKREENIKDIDEITDFMAEIGLKND